MQSGELSPGDRNHLGCRVELHRARAERDHGAVKCQIPVGEAAHIAQHFGLGAIAMKHRMREEFGAAREVRRQRHRHAICDILEREISAEGAPDGFDGRPGCCLVERDAN